MAITTISISPLSPKHAPLNLTNADKDCNSSNPSSASKGKGNKNSKSPYLLNENVQMMSRVSEKRFVQKKNEMFSSFPLAANIYRPSSAEFKTVKKSKKVKKPTYNVSNTPALKACTVSDMSNSEYFDHKCCEKENVKSRMPSQVRKYKRKPKAFQIYDRDAVFGLNCSSTELVGKRHGDGKTQKEIDFEDFAGQDVWTVLQNINQFQFNRIQQLSEVSLQTSEKKRNTHKASKLTWAKPQLAKRTVKNIRKGRRLIETVRTEEMTYVANIEIEEKAASSMSRSSSFDRVTVINADDLKSLETKQDNIKAIHRVIRPKNMQLSTLPLAEKNNRRKSPKPITSTEKPASPTVSEQKVMQKPTNSPTSRFQREYIPKQFNSLPKPLSRRQNPTIIRNPIEQKRDTKQMLADVISSESQDSSNYFREENESQCTAVEKQLVHSNDTKELVRRGLTYNANQSDVPSRQYERKPKTITKMSAMEIKKKLAQIRFPITILNKDELTSAWIEVVDTDPPQFYGLDKHIWPFMVSWGDNATEQNNLPDNNKRHTNDSQKLKENIVHGRLGDAHKKRTEQGEMDRGETTSSPGNKNLIKPKRQLRDKMMSIFQKHAPVLSEDSDTSDVEKENKKAKKQLDINIQQMLRTTESHNDTPKKKDSIEILHQKSPTKNLERLRMSQVVKQPWAKLRQANNVINNVMTNLTKGAYYSHGKRPSSSGDIAKPLKIDDSDKLDHKHASMQTLTLDNMTTETHESDDADQLNPDCNVSDSESGVTIPGFDESLPELEIQSLGFNQIAVKHCLANVTLQFDVAVPSNTSNISASSWCVPLSSNTNTTKVYKCSTTIWNAALPEQICTVLPTLIKSMFDLSSSISGISESNLLSLTNSDTFTENLMKFNRSYLKHRLALPGLEDPSIKPPRYGTMSSQVPWFVSNTIPVCPPFIVSPTLIEMMKGRYSCYERSLRNRSINETRFVVRKDKVNLLDVYQPTLNVKALIFILVNPRQFIMPEANSIFIDEPRENKTTVERDALASNCTALQVYQATKKEECIVSRITFCDFRNMNLLKDMWNYCRFNIHFPLPQYLGAELSVGSKCDIHVNIENQTLVSTTLSMKSYDDEKALANISNAKRSTLMNICNTRQLTPLIPIYSSQEKMLVERVSKVKEQIKIFNEKAKALLSESRTPKQSTFKFTKQSAIKTPIHSENETSIHSIIKTPKINVGSIKHYTDCKSTEVLTCLDKIENMDDFLEALGSGKHLANVFDGLSETKLMLCVQEMKNWVTYVTSPQVLLVLMLMSKKDTPNLIRLRPLVLQGIVTNRITRASELNLEIEVLENEDFKVTQYDAPELHAEHAAANSSRDDLFEELCWIAKNTAADYQQPFELSSERFLKIVLRNRKNLTPPYLRVMARYIGLGLLEQTNC